MTVLDASAILALLHDEPGADVVPETLATGILGTVDLAEVVGELVDTGVEVPRGDPCCCRPASPSRR